MSAQAAAGRALHTRGARIAGLVSALPAREIGNDVFDARFGAGPVRDVIKMIGVERRRWASPGQSTGSLCLAAGKRLLAGLDWEPGSVDAVLFVSQTPEYRLPATAFVLQRDWGLPATCLALDVNLGCSGYPQALWLGMNLIQSGAARRVLLAVGDTISKLIDPDDRSTSLLFGDACTVTALEAGTPDDDAHFVIGSDGRGATNLIVPSGAFGDYDTTADPRFAERSPRHLFMDGGEIFNFTLQGVPPLVAHTFAHAGREPGAYDAFLFHQANQFMLKHLAKKAGLPAAKVPSNIARYGNTSCASIPLLMTTDLRAELAVRPLELAMFGFGVGYSWASASLAVGPLRVIDTLDL
jgi:3-oxoacyl-[acyl-carrier-protein] synthase-3